MLKIGRVRLYCAPLPLETEKTCTAGDDTGTGPTIGSPYYPVLVLPHFGQQRVESLIFVDITDMALLGEFQMPKADASGLEYVLDESNDVLIAVDGDLDWLVMIDFRPFVDALIGSGKWKRGELARKLP